MKRLRGPTSAAGAASTGDILRQAILTLAARRLQSVVGALAVMVGVWFLVVVAGTTDSVRHGVLDELVARLSAVNLVTVFARPQGGLGVLGNTSPEQERAWATAPKLSPDDLRSIRELRSNQAGVARTAVVAHAAHGSGPVAQGDRRVAEIRILGASPQIQAVYGWELDSGRFFNERESRGNAPVVVLSAKASEELFKGDSANPIHASVRIGGAAMRVIGVLARGARYGPDEETFAVAPPGSPVRSITGGADRIDAIHLSVNDPSLVAPLKAEVEAAMRAARGLGEDQPANFFLYSADLFIAEVDRVSSLLVWFSAGLVAISVIVGGIVVTSVMRLSVIQRTTEIGMRRAAGARRRDIVRQIVAEATIVSAGGAATGAGLGWAFCSLLGVWLPVGHVSMVVVTRWAAFAFGFGVLVGIVSSVIPARDASGLDPVEAMRRE